MTTILQIEVSSIGCILPPMQVQVFDAVWKGIAIGLFMAVSVGPTLFAIIKYSMQHGHKAAVAFVLGVSVSDIMYVMLANFAILWLVELSKYSRYIGIVGGIILLGIGLAAVVRKITPKRPGKAVKIIGGGHYFRIWFSGWVLNSINPGVILSWLAAVTATVGKPHGYRLILFSVCLVLILGIDFLKIALAERIRKVLTPRIVVYVQRGLAVVFIVLGGLLLFKTFMSPAGNI